MADENVSKWFFHASKTSTLEMPAQHFTRTDLIGVALGTVLFLAFLVPPGYAVGWIFDLLAFRKQTWSWQVMISLLLSIGTAPIIVFLLWTYVGPALVWSYYAIAGLLFPILSRRARRGRIAGWVLGAMLVWLAIVWCSGVDLQFGHRLYTSVLSNDFNLRSALIDGIARFGLPARNPLFYPGHPVPLRYHYFWLIPCALVDLAGGRWVDARQALIASDVWCGWAVMALIALYLRYFHPRGERDLGSRAKWGVMVLAIAGLDVVPVLLVDEMHVLTGQGPIFASVEWWNNQVTPLLDSMLWVAHHTGSALACLTGFLLLWMGTRTARRRPWAAGVFSGMCFASALGLSVYVTFTFAIFLLLWGAVTLLRGKRVDRIAWLLAGTVTVACALPYLRTLSGSGGTSAKFVLLGIRTSTPVIILGLRFGLSAKVINLASLITLPLNYFVETGVWSVLACVWFRRALRNRRRVSEAEWAALTMFAVSVLTGSFFRSGVITNNDLSWRSLLIAEFVLLVWSVGPIRAWWRTRKSKKIAISWRAPVALLIVLGIGTSVYELIILRVYFPLVDIKAIQEYSWFPVGRLAYDARQAYTQLLQLTPSDAVLQGNPTHWNDVLHGLYAMRQTASFDASCGEEFGGTGNCAVMQSQIAPLFNNPLAARTANIDSVCRTWGIDVLVVTDDDPVFRDHHAWPWVREPIVSNEGVRAVACGGSPAHSLTQGR